MKDLMCLQDNLNKQDRYIYFILFTVIKRNDNQIIKKIKKV